MYVYIYMAREERGYNEVSQNNYSGNFINIFMYICIYTMYLCIYIYVYCIYMYAYIYIAREERGSQNNYMIVLGSIN
jgi:hypothetical protein